jgi:thymidylate synthase (FAD)
MLDRRDVLDKGFVILDKMMGDDKEIAEDARASTKFVRHEDRTTTDGDIKLIRYLAEHNHTSPFEQVELKFIVKAPIFVIREWMRHRTWNYNEQSGRYSEYGPEWYIPDMSRMQLQDTKNKQSSADGLINSPGAARELMAASFRTCFNNYQYLLECGLAREIARMVLPVSMYSVFVAKTDLHNLHHFLVLRCAPDAQWEIRQYANAIREMVEKQLPVAMKVLDFERNVNDRS